MPTMTRLGGACALALALLSASPETSSAQCLKCRTFIDRTTGQLKCDVDPATGGYYDCSCPCECTGQCGQTGSATFEELLADPGRVPVNGIQVTGFDPQRAAGRITAGTAGESLRGRSVYFARGFGLASYPDGTWRAFPLDTPETFLVRSCTGGAVGRVARGEAAGPASSGEILRALM
jgi:hypothetical protein